MAEHKQPTTRSMLRQLMDNITDNIYFMDRDGRIIMLNKAGAEWLGFQQPDDAIGMTDYDIFTEEHAAEAFLDEQRIIRTGEPVVGKEEKETWEDGRTTWVSTTKMPLRDDEGNVAGVFGISRNITAHKLNELKLKEYARTLGEINDRLDEELRMAANLQQAFLPQYYPSYPGEGGQPALTFHHFYQADAHMGGDLCSIHPLDDTRAGLLVCDVMGHGVRAALITGILRTLTVDLALGTSTPGEFLTELNLRLYPLLRAQEDFIFVTASYVIIDTRTGELTGASAGHTRPLRIRPSSREVTLAGEREERPDSALVVTEGLRYRTWRDRLVPGDAVVLYTDGIHEVLDSRGRLFGLDRLQDVFRDHAALPLDRMIGRVVEDVRGSSVDGEFMDDVCLLGFVFRPRGPDPGAD